MQEYTGDVIPFQEYDGQVIPFSDEEKRNLNKDTASKTKLENELEQRKPSDLERFQEENGSIPNPIPAIVGLGKGVVNAGIGAIEGAQAVGNAIGETYNEYAPSLGLPTASPEAQEARKQEVLAQQQALGDLKFKPQSLSEEITIPTGEVGAGMMAGGALAKPFQVGGRIAQGGIKLAGQSLGAATAAPEQNGLIVKDNGWFGFNVDPNEEPGKAAVKHRINLALDNIAATAALTGVGRGANILGKFANGIYRNLKDWGNLDSATRKYTGDLFETWSNLPPDASKEMRIAKLNEAIDKFDKLGEKTYPMGEGIDDKVLQRDPVSVLTNDLNTRDAGENATKTHLESLRASAKAGNAPNTTVILGQPKAHLDDALSQVQEVRGGDQAIEQTKQNLQQTAREEAEAQRFGVDTAKQDLVSEETGLQNALRNDETFGQKIKDADNAGVSLDINKESLDKQTDIVNANRDRLKQERNIRDAAYQKVADSGAAAHMDEFNQVAADNDGYLSDKMKTLIDNADGSYGYLNNKIKPQITKELNGLSGKNYDPDRADALKALRRNIDEDQIAWLTEQGEESTVQAAQAARQANVEYSKLYNEGVGQKLRRNEDINRVRETDRLPEGRSIVTSVIKDPNKREQVDQLRKILGPENEGLIGDVALTEAMKDVTAGKGTNIQKITSDLQQMAASFPDKQKQRIEGFLTDIRDRGATIDDLKKRIPELEKAANDEIDKVYMGKFDGLFKKEFGEYKGVNNGYRAFQKMLDNKEGASIGKMIEAAKNDPGSMKGLETAWTKAAEEKLKQNSVDVVPFGEEFEKYGKQIFGEDNPTVNSILELRKESERIAGAQRMAATRGFDTVGNQQKALRAMKSITTMLFGVLNPTAARINVVTSNLAADYNANKISHQAIDKILSDNETVKNHLKEMLDKAQNSLSGKQKQAIIRMGINMGLYGLRDQTDQALGDNNPGKKEPLELTVTPKDQK